jgi:LuxR family maltose regulon positive regulatory protein
MARRIPYVADGVLHAEDPPGRPEIAVDSAAWAMWLGDRATHSFSFQSPAGTFTARKERRSGADEEYWTAYRKRGGRLRKVYLGKAERLTLARLEDAAAVLSGHGDKATKATASLPPDATSGGERSRGADATATVGSTTADDQVVERARQTIRGDSLLLTKLSVPTARPSLVARPRLAERLEEGLKRKLTLVSAPAGFGKTTLLSVWVSERSGGRTLAWLSLDSGDNDPARFWRYFVTAIDQLQPGSVETALALLGSPPQAPPIEAVLTTLLNELADLEADAVLILDDYHLIESRAIHEALTFLIEHLPARMHLVISTRADPPLALARLRVRNEMAEVRAADLRFTPSWRRAPKAG